MAKEVTPERGSWITVSGEDGAALAERLEREVAERRANGTLHESEERLAQELTVLFSTEGFSTTPTRLEMLRALCCTFNVDFKPAVARSHRKIIGPVIATVKRAMVPFLRALLGPSYLKQTDFNATVVKLLGELCNERR